MTSTRYDLDPHARLPWPHLAATVRRRLLVSYPVDPELLAERLPPGAELTLAHGHAWISACIVRIDDMRPADLPAALGVGFRYLIHRTRVRLPYPDGVLRESVLVLEANIDRASVARIARVTSGIRFVVRDIAIEGTETGWRVRMADRQEVLFDAEIDRGAAGRLPAASAFDDAADAERVLLGVSHGGQWQPERGRLRLLAETHDPWRPDVGSCTTHENRFLETLGATGMVADHAIVMADVPHAFAWRGFDVMVGSAPGETGAGGGPPGDAGLPGRTPPPARGDNR